MTPEERKETAEQLDAFVESIKLNVIEEGPNRERVVVKAECIWSSTGERSIRVTGRNYSRNKILATKWCDFPVDSEPGLDLQHTITLVIRDVLDHINKGNRPKSFNSSISL